MCKVLIFINLIIYNKILNRTSRMERWQSFNTFLNIPFKHHKRESSESAGEQRRNDINNELQLGTPPDTVQQWIQNKTNNLYLWNGKQLDYFKKKYDCLIIASAILSGANGAQKLYH